MNLLSLDYNYKCDKLSYRRKKILRPFTCIPYSIPIPSKYYVEFI